MWRHIRRWIWVTGSAVNQDLKRIRQTSRSRRHTVPGWADEAVTRARRVRVGGEEVEAPPHSVASAPRVAPHDLTRLGRMRPGAVRSTREDSGRPPESSRTDDGNTSRPDGATVSGHSSMAVATQLRSIL